MTPPERIQRRRTRGWRMPIDAIAVSRPGKWGNPWRVAEADGEYEVHNDAGESRGSFPDRAEASGAAVTAFQDGLTDEYRAAARYELAGHDLACWCPLRDAQGQPWPCHADVLLRIANY
jgi:hypothetical protein